MDFSLSEELINEIIFSMEDQTSSYIFDSESCTLVKKESIDETKSDKYISLPTWDSVKGFHVMERFVSHLRNPMARVDLRDALFSGHGVFRNFKNVLKKYPEVYKMWHLYKEKEMKQIVVRWYNGLSEIWGFEKFSEDFEDDELIFDDFVFREYESKDEEHILLSNVNIVSEIEERFSGELGCAMSDLWLYQQEISCLEDDFTMIVETVSGDFAGFASLSVFSANAPQTVLLSTLFIEPDFRGLGLAKGLLETCLNKLKQRKIRWVLVSNSVISEKLGIFFLKLGFKKIDNNYLIDLFE